jgi:hypothetical protein
MGDTRQGDAKGQAPKEAVDDGDIGTLAEQGQHIAHNMAEVFDISGQIWQKWMQGQIREQRRRDGPEGAEKGRSLHPQLCRGA